MSCRTPRPVVRAAFVLALLLGAPLGAPLAAQSAATAETGLDAAARSTVIERAIAALQAGYVFPEMAERAADDLRARLARGEYDETADRAAFARALTEHLQALTKDKHLRVRDRPPQRPAAAAAAAPETSPFGRVEILDGNIGYVEIRTFGRPADAVRELTRDAMTAVADADALIIDLRANGGGDPGFVALVSSYLFDDEPVHLNSLYYRPADRTEHFHTDPGVAGRKFGGSRPIYVLTSARTFSAAEEFSYNLQSRKRATIVGETTGGGAHPGGYRQLPHGFAIFVPSGRAINPITGTNWEGVGVIPELAVPADQALEAALQRARERRAHD